MKQIFWTVLMLFTAQLLFAQGGKLDLAKVKGGVVTCHVNGKSAPLPKGAGMQILPDGLKLTYVFPSKGHDACMVEFPVELPEFSSFTVTLSVPAPGHRPFMVLTDKNNEKHYFSMVPLRMIANQAIKRKGRMTIKGKILIANKHPGEYFAFRWGGDDNQKIDFPVKKLMLGLNDHPDSFIGKGEITFHSMTFQK